MNSPRDLHRTLSKPRRFNLLAPLENLLHRFSPSERLALYILTASLSLSSLALLAGVNAAVSTTVPSYGGTLTEGVLGPSRFVNPVLAISSADHDLAALVYSGLMRTTPDGSLVPDLASQYEITDDGTTYTFTIREGAEFHDGTPVTAEDIVFTVQLAQNPDVKSPRRADWEGVTATAHDPRTVVFKLPRAYAPFLYNATLGILPKHLWDGTKSEDLPFHRLNTHPIGSGPYRMSDVRTDDTGAAQEYVLSAFDGFVYGTPHLRMITIRVYPNSDALVAALNAGAIDALAGLPSSAVNDLRREDIEILRVPLPRVFGVFFNQGHAPALADQSARAALDAAIDRERLIDMVLSGYGVPLTGPIPPGILELAETKMERASSTPVSTVYTQETLDRARDILSRGGWKFDAALGTWKKGTQELSFTLATGDAQELTATGNALVAAWKQLGAKVTLQVYPISELNTTVIRSREYDAVLFGEVVGRDADLFAFWHSSQRNDPGLNLSLYTSARADTLLSQARATTDKDARDNLYREFENGLRSEYPAVFLYAPEFLYVVPRSVSGVTLGALAHASDRYLNVYQWYSDTERVWNIFVK